MRIELRREEGSALITAVLLMAVMLTVSLATLGLVESQQRESGRERKREATFTLSEGVMNSQIFLLSRDWPGTAGARYPTSCSRTNQADVRCPDTTRLTTSFKGADFSRGIEWNTEIRDNTEPTAENYYDDTFVRSQPTYDVNEDSYMWVRAQGILPSGKSRVIVALVKAEVLTTNFPRHAVLAGSIDITQNGNHSYIWSRSASGENGSVVVRCGTAGQPPASGCVNWDPGKAQISPAAPLSQPGTANALSSETIDRLREQAKVDGTYYAAGVCTPEAKLTGPLVFMENPTGCDYGSSGAVYNSSATPGVIVVGSGNFYMNHGTYYGLLYHVNGSDGVGTPQPNGQAAVTMKANSAVVGQVIIDGTGRLEAGNNNGGPNLPGNIVYDGNARNSLRAFGTAGIVQNSFREIKPAS